MNGIVFDIQRFCTHDGPGIRTTVFLKGCPLKCRWCHNPESKKMAAELLFSPNMCIDCGNCDRVCPKEDVRSILSGSAREDCGECLSCADVCDSGTIKLSGREMSVQDVMTEVLKDADFYDECGGLTISGGEPLLQSDFTIELAKAAREANITVCLETCGFAKSEDVQRAAEFVDLWLYDVKDTDSNRHLANTGVELDVIMRNLELLDSLGAVTVLRCILVKNDNDNIEHYSALAKIYNRLENCMGIELLPYHSLGNSKLEQLGIGTRQGDFELEEDEINAARKLLAERL
ncbi:MAG: glycyl-radical enzyme activating protein [Sedimentisphaeraceae bacterium JB056]